MDCEPSHLASDKGPPVEDRVHKLPGAKISATPDSNKGHPVKRKSYNIKSTFPAMSSDFGPLSSLQEYGGSQRESGDQSLDCEMQKIEMREDISPARKAVDTEYNYNEHSHKALQTKDTNTMLVDYLNEMKSRRQELQALRTRPEWVLLPVSPIQRTSYAVDEESHMVGTMLHDFFNPSTPTVTNDTMVQDIRQQDPTNYADTVDLQQPRKESLANSERCTSDAALPLASRVPYFKHTHPSAILGEMAQVSQTLEFKETVFAEDIKEVPRTTNFNSLDYRLREYIWTLALPRTRIIELDKSATYSIRSEATIPAALHTCRESRAIAIKHYRLAFSAPSTSPKVYIDFKNDWIYTRCTGCLGLGCTHKLTLTEYHKELNGLIFQSPMTFNPFPKILRLYPTIERLILISGRSNIKRGAVHKDDISFITQVFEWDSEGDLMGLARKAWKDMYPAGERPLALSQIWRATLPGIVDDIKRSDDPPKGLWTCCS